MLLIYSLCIPLIAGPEQHPPHSDLPLFFPSQGALRRPPWSLWTVATTPIQGRAVEACQASEKEMAIVFSKALDGWGRARAARRAVLAKKPPPPEGLSHQLLFPHCWITAAASQFTSDFIIFWLFSTQPLNTFKMHTSLKTFIIFRRKFDSQLTLGDILEHSPGQFLQCPMSKI